MDPLTLPSRQLRRNLDGYLQMVARSAQQDKQSRVAIFALDRSFGRTIEAVVYFDKCPTLTTANAQLFILSVQDHQLPWHERKYHRYLANSERFRLQGHDGDLASRVSRKLGVTMAGNAFAVSQIAAVAVPIWRCIADSGFLATRDACRRTPTQLQALSVVPSTPTQLQAVSLAPTPQRRHNVRSLEQYIVRCKALGSRLSARELEAQWWAGMASAPEAP